MQATATGDATATPSSQTAPVDFELSSGVPPLPPSSSYAASGPSANATSGPSTSTPSSKTSSASGATSSASGATSSASGATSLPRDTPGDGDEILPTEFAGGDLREAVGAKPEKKKRKRAQTPPPDDPAAFDDDFGKPKSRKTIIVSALSLVVGLGIAAVIFLGRANSAWFYISCEPDRIVAQQGRSFPPWGESALDGKQWAPIKIPPEAECLPLETEDEDELATAFRNMLVKRASVLLTAKEVTKTDEASALLEQALLHARSNTDAARTARGDIQRLLGDVVYWRASLKMRDASKSLLEAAKQFDAAAQQRPRHVTDAASWAEYVRKIVGDLEAGPSGTTQTFPPMPPPTPDKEPAPPGVALPVEPDKGSASEAPPPTPDAGLPTGGVLL